MNPYAALLSGILAAFTPCVVVLIPALIYRFSNTGDKKPWLAIGQFTLSFLIVYIISALFLAKLFSSTVRYGLQLGIGLLFVVLGVLALLRRFNPLQFQLIKNPFIFGLVFALLVSVNPCVFAYLGVLFATTHSQMLVVSMLAFAIGLLIPSLFFAIFGKALLTKIKRAQKIIHHVSQGMNVLLVFIGIYMIYTIKHLAHTDILVTGFFMLLTFAVVIRSFFILQGPKRFRRIENIVLFAALLIILFAVVFHCDAHLRMNASAADIDANNPFHIDNLAKTNVPVQATCSAHVEDCEICQRCILIFALGSVLGFLAIVGTRIYTKKHEGKQEKKAKK